MPPGRPPAAKSPPAPSRPSGKLILEPPAAKGGHRIVLYGPGGIGKTTLAVTAPGPVAVFDLDESLPVLLPRLTEAGVDVRVVGGTDSWSGIREALHADGWEGIRTLVIDSATRAEELALAHTLATVPHEKGYAIRRIEDYGYGKGYQYLFDNFLPILSDLDAHVRAGRNVILVCHDCTANVPNPAGEDFIRYEPRLQSPSSGKASIRLRVREWADHVLFVGYDLVVKDGKATGSGTRTIYPCELPICMAKSRTLADQIPYPQFDRALWTSLFGESV
jgi:hypothetical protein